MNAAAQVALGLHIVRKMMILHMADLPEMGSNIALSGKSAC